MSTRIFFLLVNENKFDVEITELGHLTKTKDLSQKLSAILIIYLLKVKP